ncbi:hypothetical protein [Saccharothrix saharensis]|uniref:hypothetical protein n=1 Tax=Saccharothrix saharensis TaxID=571190 RepID=UPI003CCC7371
MTVDVDVASTTTPPTSAPIDSVAWNDDVNTTAAASGARGTAEAIHVCEHTGTAPYASPHTTSSTSAPASHRPTTGNSAVATPAAPHTSRNTVTYV